MNGLLTSEDKNVESCLKKIHETPTMEGLNLSKKVSTKQSVKQEMIDELRTEIESLGGTPLTKDQVKYKGLLGKDKYGLKPSEAKIKPESGSGNIKVKTGTKLKNFSLILECHKESGFTTI